ncbi:hypothetical protein HK099_003664 [Clydaea vesicula]|uniref:Rab-GAP TBC domain-containing protein n=1 Tax=Clydaea vesicula TaxID=447962 RepID=A0AAD5U5Z9_9FUNG|nr:hypothetical protein HK099_003664 [Clydaea vesicula]
MSTSVEEFNDLVNSEMLVDMNKLRESSRHGIPFEVRAKVWICLLSVQATDKTDAGCNNRNYEEYIAYQKGFSVLGDLSKRLRGDCSRYKKHLEMQANYHNNISEVGVNGYNQQNNNLLSHNFTLSPGDSLASISVCSASPPPSPPSDTELYNFNNSSNNSNGNSRRNLLKEFTDFNISLILENVVSCYLQLHKNIDYSQSLVFLCGPFCLTEHHYLQHSLSDRIANFLMLFRVLLPELYTHFEEEDLNFHEWTTTWFSNLLSKELPLECVLRLWDTYFSISDGYSLHTYVCLAVLNYMKENLEELEQSEIRGALNKLPNLDMDQVIGQAFNFKNEVIQRSLSYIP